MSTVAVTVHKGELRQIRRFIKEAKEEQVEGRLYGLWTHTDQPVIQFVVGPYAGKEGIVKGNYFENCSACLREDFGIRCLGFWSTNALDITPADKSVPCFVKMEVSLISHAEKMHVDLHVAWQDPYSKQKGEMPGVLEQLEGDSAFRLFPALVKKMANIAGCDPADIGPDHDDLAIDSTDPKVVLKPAEVKEEQWYSTQQGMELFSKMHAAFLQNEMTVTGTSRDTQTHDIGVTIRFKSRQGRVEFPRNFPQGKAVLITGQSHQELTIQPKASGEPTTEPVNQTTAQQQQMTDNPAVNSFPLEDPKLLNHDGLAEVLVQQIKRQLITFGESEL